MSFIDNERFRKVPWGVLGGICLIVIFYVTAGIIAAFVVSNAVAGATHRSAGLFDSWWQILLFVTDILFVLACAWSFVMRFLVRGRKAVKGGAEE